jgi:HPr kinase/phosphorylase
LSGFWDYFASERPQLIGKAEMSYLYSLDDATRRERLERFFAYNPPCLIVCHHMACVDGLVESAARHGVPVYSRARTPSSSWSRSSIT